jgi:hypothetical protein
VCLSCSFVDGIFRHCLKTQPDGRMLFAAVTTRLSISVQQPKFLKFIMVNKAVVSRTLFFSPNWFCASINICRQLPFKLFQDMFLLSAVWKEVKPRSSVHVPYQMSLEAREHMAIFVLRTDFFIARVIHRTITTIFKKNACVVDPADLSVGAGEIYCAKDMKVESTSLWTRSIIFPALLRGSV